MACVYEEEIFAKNGIITECGCKTCPYKNIKECKEIKPLFSAACHPDSVSKTLMAGSSSRDRCNP